VYCGTLTSATDLIELDQQTAPSASMLTIVIGIVG
jgi:hypothetical protein